MKYKIVCNECAELILEITKDVFSEDELNDYIQNSSCSLNHNNNSAVLVE